MIKSIDAIFKGFPIRAEFGPLGWASVGLIRTDSWAALVDGGIHANRRQMYDRIRACGAEPEEIKYIFLTHLHWDHANNLDLFPDAQIFVSRAEWEIAANSHSPAYYRPTIDDIAKRGVTLFEGEGEYIAEGVRAFLAPGHTMGSAAFIAEWNGKRYALAGDAVKNRYELGGSVAMTEDAEVSRQSIEKIKAMSDVILPGHDGWLRLEEGRVIAEDRTAVELEFTGEFTMDGRSKHELLLDDGSEGKERGMK